MARINKDYLLVLILAVVGAALIVVGLTVDFTPQRLAAGDGGLEQWFFVGLGALSLLAALLFGVLAARRRRQMTDPDHAAHQPLLEEIFTEPAPLEPGIYHLRSGDAFAGYRVHLRIEPSGNGTLVINAAKIIHLNHTAAEYAKLIVEERDKAEAVREITNRYRVPRKVAAADYDRIARIITEMATGADVCPVTYLDLERTEPFSVETFAPYRVDLVLTYACDNTCAHCYVAEDHKGKISMEPADWRRVMDILWEVGVPHVTFTGGEATLHPHLRGLIEYAEDLGLVTGLLTNGRKLADKDYLAGLVEAGLDHVQITLESHDEAVHDAMVGVEGAWKQTVQGVRNALELPLYVLTNTTLTKRNVGGLEQTVEFLAELGLPQVAANGMIHAGGGVHNPEALTEAELQPHVETFFETANRLGLNFLWYTPTRYEDFDPVELGVGIKTCSAARYNLAVEPDGAVLPCQSYFESLGNLLTDGWDAVWNNPLAVNLRKREWAPEECRRCTQFPLCGGGCPLLYKEDGGQVTCVGTS